MENIKATTFYCKAQIYWKKEHVDKELKWVEWSDLGIFFTEFNQNVRSQEYKKSTERCQS